MKLTQARPRDVLERRGDRGDVIVVQVLNVFTTSVPASGDNVRCADYCANDGRDVYRMRADEDPDVWTLVDACAECGQRRRWAESEWCEACYQRLGIVDGTIGFEMRNGQLVEVETRG